MNTLAKDTLIYGLSVVLNPLINTFFLLKVLTSKLDQYEFGVYTYFYAIAGILMVLYSMRMETTYFRMIGDHPEPKVFSQSFSTVVMMSTCLSVLIWISASPLAEWMGISDYKRYFRYFSVILWLDAFCAIPFARLRYHEKSLKFSLLKIFNVLLTLLVILLLFFFLPQFSLTASIFNNWNALWLDGLFICNLIASFALFLYFIRHIKHLHFNNWDRPLIRKMLIYTSPLILVSLAGNANQLLDRLLIPFLSAEDITSGMSNNGIYGSATKIATIMLLFSKAFNYAFDPYVFKSYQQRKNTNHLGRIALFYTLVSGIILVFGVCFSELLSLLLGSDFTSGMQYVPLLLFGYFLLGLYYHFSVWYKLNDKTMIGAWIAMIGVVITTIFNFILVPKIHLFGPPLTLIINYIFLSCICIYWGRQHLPISYPLGRMTLHILWSLVLSISFIFYFSHSDSSGIWATVIVLLYSASLVLIERKLLTKVLSRT